MNHNNPHLQKFGKSTCDIVLGGTETKLLASGSKPQIHERYLEFTR